jgi:hypothetical protein
MNRASDNPVAAVPLRCFFFLAPCGSFLSGTFTVSIGTLTSPDCLGLVTKVLTVSLRPPLTQEPAEVRHESLPAMTSP